MNKMNFGQVVSSSPPIAENILKYVNARDLCSCAKVCSLWNKIAQTEKKRRLNIGWFFQVHYQQHMWIFRDYGIALMSRPGDCNTPCGSNSNCLECSLSATKNHEEEMRKVFEAVRIHPHFCISFATTGFLSSFEKLFPAFKYPSEPAKKKARNNYHLRDYLRAVKEKALKEHLPDQCPISFIISPGVVGCRKNAVPVEVEEGTALSGLLFPKVPGMKIYHYAVDGRRCNIDKLVPTDASVKCLLVFLTQRGSPLAAKLVQSCLVREHGRVAVGGAIVDRTESLTGTAIVFCGPSVKAASIILTQGDGKEQFERKLKQFRQSDLLNKENKCFAFMFACVARGFHLHKEYNIESSIFRKLYPDVPLIGLFGNGEIGITNIPYVYETKYEQLKPSQYYHSYSTVFVLVSVKM